MELTLADTKKIHLHNMLLLEPPETRSAVDIITKLGYVQLDTIYVTARSQDLVLHSRSLSYQEKDVWIDHQNQRLLEEFAHARSLIPLSEFPYYYRKMLLRRNSKPKWFEMVKQPEDLIARTLQLVREEGEITTSDVPVNQEFTSNWSGLNKRVLDYLTLRGFTHVKRRENFSTVYYGLLEDIIPDIPEEDELPSRMEVFWHDIYTTLDNHGIVPFHRLLHYTYSQRTFRYNNKRQSPRRMVKKAIDEGKIEEHQVAGTDIPYYSRPGYLVNTDLPNLEEPQVFLLSPFDNVMWSREALEDQYQFQYKFEGYTPKKKRKYGFYSLPILYGIDFVGRVDTKLDRSSQTMMFKQWTWESAFQPTTHFWDRLAITISRFLSFHQATATDWGDLDPVYRKELTDRL